MKKLFNKIAYVTLAATMLLGSTVPAFAEGGTLSYTENFENISIQSQTEAVALEGFKAVSFNDDIKGGAEKITRTISTVKDGDNTYLVYDSEIVTTSNAGVGLRFELPQKVDLTEDIFTVAFRINIPKLESFVRGVVLGDSSVTCNDFMHSVCLCNNVGCGSMPNSGFFCSSTKFNGNGWHNVRIVVDYTNGATSKIYVDDVQEACAMTRYTGPKSVDFVELTLAENQGTQGGSNKIYFDDVSFTQGNYNPFETVEPEEPEMPEVPDEPEIPDEPDEPEGPSLGGVDILDTFDYGDISAEPAGSVELADGFVSASIDEDIAKNNVTKSYISFAEETAGSENKYLRYTTSLVYNSGHQTGSGIRFHLPDSINLDSGAVTISFKINAARITSGNYIRGIHLGQDAMTCENFMHGSCCHRAALNYWAPAENVWYDIKIVYTKTPGSKEAKVVAQYKTPSDKNWNTFSGTQATPNVQSISEIDFIEFTLFNNVSGTTRDVEFLFDDFAVTQYVLPNVTSVSVAEGDDFVEPGKAIDINFDIAVLPESVTTQNIILTKKDGTALDGTAFDLVQSDNLKTVSVVFRDGEPMEYLTEYVLTVQNIRANTILQGAMNDPKTVNFRTMGRYEVRGLTAAAEGTTVKASYNMYDYVSKNNGTSYIVVSALVHKDTNTTRAIDVKKLTSSQQNGEVYQNSQMNVSLTAPADFSADEYEVKVFVWDSFTDTINLFKAEADVVSAS